MSSCDSPRFSIIPGDFVDDRRARLIHYQIINQLGRRTNQRGWCVISQTKLAQHLEVARQTVSRAIKDLVGWGYVEKRGQEITRRNVCFYRVIMDRGDPLATPRNEPPDTGVEQVEGDGIADGVQDAADTPEIDSQNVALSSQDDTWSDDALSSQDDTSVAPESDTSVAPEGDTITNPLKNNVPPPTTNGPNESDSVFNRAATGPPRGRGKFDLIFEDLRSQGHGKVIDHFLIRVTNAIQVRHDSPRSLFAEIAKALGGETEPILVKAADVIIDDRAVLMAPKNAKEALAKAKQLLREAPASKPAGITITKAANRQQWAAWRKAAEREPRRYGGIAKIMQIASQCDVPSSWPPPREADP